MFLTHDGTIEQLLRKVEVGIALVFRHQWMRGSAVFLKAVDGLEDKGIDDCLVVVPIDILVFQQFGEFVVVTDELTVDDSPHFAVLFVTGGLALHIVLVEVAFLYLII